MSNRLTDAERELVTWCKERLADTTVPDRLHLATASLRDIIERLAKPIVLTDAMTASHAFYFTQERNHCYDGQSCCPVETNDINAAKYALLELKDSNGKPVFTDAE